MNPFSVNNLFLFHFVLFVIALSTAQSQTVSPFYEIGYFTDADRQPIDGFIDITYEPKTREDYGLTLGADFTPGCYYNLQGEKVNGRIQYTFNDNFFRFTPPSGGSKFEKITPAMCSAYVIGKDSFTVIRDFTIERELATIPFHEPEFAEVLTTIGDLTFYQHTRVGQNKLLYTYMVKRGKEGKLVSFPKGKNKFKAVALDYFSSVPYLVTGINDETMSDNDLLNMIKYMDFANRTAKKEKIYYSASWEELSDSSAYGYLYYADSLRTQAGTCSLHYFIKDGTPLYDASYASLAPQKKEGLLTFYFPDGKVRKRVIYKNNEIKGVINTYYRNGQQHYVYEKKNEATHVYSIVADQSGRNLLDATGGGVEVFYDSIQNRQITRTYRDYKLTDSYYTDNAGNKVYQSHKNHAALYNKEVLENNEFIKQITYPKIAIANNVHGMIIVRILADREGNTTKVMVVKGLDYECDKTVLGYCQSKYKGKNWYPLKVDKMLSAQEILMVFVLEITPYSRYRNNYYYNNMWSRQMMWQQQMMSMPAPMAPRF
jgi:antitoxin component YwqK of YwqJK toxin-antitoxin module